MRNDFIYVSLFLILVIGLLGYNWPIFFWFYALVGPFIILGLYDLFQKKHALMRNFPVLGRGRYVMEFLRPKIYQYFVESDVDGKPFARIFRSIVYQRAKNVRDTAPFGTQLELYEEGYEWMNHSINSLDPKTLEKDPRILVGNHQSSQPYSASLFNVSAMSFGSLSKNAVLALNGGAKMGGFAHNTGEGGISQYHNEYGGDLIYQIGTGYFGCRSESGGFEPDLYKALTGAKNVKMIELKLSQGAKPGHGGILPAHKVTDEIAKIRHIKPNVAVHSPPYHKEFSTPEGLIQFIGKLRELSGGKPVGFKLCIGKKSEFIGICKAIVKLNIIPDFISVDGGEGGTGAAPLEFSNSVGMPHKEGLAFVHDCLVGFDLRKDIKVFSAGKVVTGFHIFRTLCLGADATYSARAMMMALGCIQALECNKNTCPTGVATQDPELVAGLVVSDKKDRVHHYHKETMESFIELMAASGNPDHTQLNRSFINRRVNLQQIKTYDQIYPEIPVGSLLSLRTVPKKWKNEWLRGSSDKF